MDKQHSGVHTQLECLILIALKGLASSITQFTDAGRH